MHNLDASRSLNRMAVAALLVACGAAAPSLAQWNPLTGVKTGPGTDVETSLLYVGPQLSARGGVLSFLGSANINGPVLIEEQSGWGAPLVNVAGTFAAASDVRIQGAGPTLNVVGNYTQTGGEFVMRYGPTTFHTGGSFNYTGERFELIDGASFSVGNAVASSISTSFLTIGGGSSVNVGTVTAVDHVGIFDTGSLNVLGNYTQTGGEFAMRYGPTSFQTGGSFNYTGGRFELIDGASFSVGNAVASSISTSFLTIGGGSSVNVGTVTAVDHVGIFDTGSLNVLGNYTQTGGEFAMRYGPTSFHADGAFNFSGESAFIGDGASFSVGNAAASSISTNFLTIGDGSSVNVGTVTAGNTVGIFDTGSLNVLGNYTQTGGEFVMRYGPTSFQTGGSFNYTGGRFELIDGARFSVGSGVANSINTQLLLIDTGAEALLDHHTQVNVTDQIVIADGLLLASGSGTNVTARNIQSTGGAATTRVEDNAHVNVIDGLWIAGQMVVRGPGSLVSFESSNIDKATYIQAYGGNGTLAVDNSGAFRSNIINLGNDPGIGSEGVLNVASGGSVLHIGNSLNVGLRARGILNVNTGGTVSGGYGRLARRQGSQGAATIEGVGSQWSVEQDMFVGGHTATGAGGTGLLQVRNGGTVTVGTVLRTWDAGSVNVRQGGRLLVGQGDVSLVPNNAVEVGPGGTLAGTGVIDGHVQVMGGILSPGHSAGSMLIQGNLFLSSSSTTYIEIGGPEPVMYDRINVTNTVDASTPTALGGTLIVSFINGYVPNSIETLGVLTSASGFSGSFDQIELRNVDPSLVSIDHVGTQLSIHVIPLCSPCPADFDMNGGVDGGDLAAFFTDFEAGTTCADVDLNGGVDGGDLAYFFSVFEAGGCD